MSPKSIFLVQKCRQLRRRHSRQQQPRKFSSPWFPNYLHAPQVSEGTKHSGQGGAEA